VTAADYSLHTPTSKREREFIFHIATTLEQAHSRNTKLGGLPERHLAHQSWPPIKAPFSIVGAFSGPDF